MKVFNTQLNVGKCKYIVNHHDGIKKHPDGSKFFDISIFNNKWFFNSFIKKLKEQGYKEQ